MFEGLYGLSCVENQTLAFLRGCGMDIRPFYRDAAVPLGELFRAFVTEAGRPETFGGIVHVQELAKERGVISLTLVQEPDADKAAACSAAACKAGTEAVLIPGTPEFTKTALFARGFREDHYVRITPHKNRFMLYNDLPDKAVAVTTEELAAAYDGEYFTLALLRPIDGDDWQWSWDARSYRIEDMEAFACAPDMMDGIDIAADYAARLRDMAGMCKLLRYRMAEYYGQYTDTGFILDVMPEYERIHSVMEFYRLKPKITFDKIWALAAELFETDNSLMRKLRGMMERMGRP